MGDCVDHADRHPWEIKPRPVAPSTWFDPQKETEAATTLINQGVDVLMQITDSAAPLQTAKAHGIVGFGWDTDMSHWGVVSRGPILSNRARRCRPDPRAFDQQGAGHGIQAHTRHIAPAAWDGSRIHGQRSGAIVILRHSADRATHCPVNDPFEAARGRVDVRWETDDSMHLLRADD